MSIKYLAKNSITNKWYGDDGFTIPNAIGEQAKALTFQEQLVLKHTFLNVEIVSFNAEPTFEEIQESDKLFLQLMNQ